LRTNAFKVIASFFGFIFVLSQTAFHEWCQWIVQGASQDSEWNEAWPNLYGPIHTDGRPSSWTRWFLVRKFDSDAPSCKISWCGEGLALFAATGVA